MFRTLIVDDAALIRIRLREILVKAGCDIVGEAANGDEAVESYKELRPDLVTLDISMPEMNGIEALKQIMAIDNTVKIIIISAVGQKVLIAEALRNGAKAFIIKPFDPQKVIEKVKRVLIPY